MVLPGYLKEWNRLDFDSYFYRLLGRENTASICGDFYELKLRQEFKYFSGVFSASEFSEHIAGFMYITEKDTIGVNMSEQLYC